MDTQLDNPSSSGEACIGDGTQVAPTGFLGVVDVIFATHELGRRLEKICVAENDCQENNKTELKHLYKIRKELPEDQETTIPRG